MVHAEKLRHKDKGEMEEGAAAYLRSAPWTESLDRYPHLEEVFAAFSVSITMCIGRDIFSPRT